MRYRTVKIAVATVLWTTAVGLAVVATIANDARFMLWCLLAALVACAVTEHIITESVIHSERLRVEDLVDALVAKAAQRAADAAMDRIH